MNDCIFCRIAAKEIPAKVVYEDDRIVAFDDIRPQAPVHTLIIPREHIASLNAAGPGKADLLAHIFGKAPEIAEIKGIQSSGYRLVVNTGPDSGQDVFHVHVHLLGGRKMQWPPG
jgi:histidine triad (HIT) family protein